MPRKALVLSLLCFLAAFTLAAPTPADDGAAPQKSPQADAERRSRSPHLRQGLAAFEQGFYELLPKGRRAEADAAFALAMRELDLALEAEPLNKEAHRALARIQSLRQDHLAAAEHYRRLTEIDPLDVDSYALAALSLAEAGRFAESRIELEKAKARTTDEKALALLDGYLAKLAAAEKKAGAGR